VRAVLVGAGSLTVMTVHILLERGHEVVVIERDKARITALSEELNCGFLQGDGSKPAILREAGPKETDILYCLTGNDQVNIIAGLVGNSLGFPRVVTKIEDPEFEHICIELGLEDTIIPVRTTGLHLADMLEGQSAMELSTMIRDQARAFSFVAGDADQGTLAALALPDDTRVVCIYRDGKFIAAGDDLKLKAEDEVVIVTHRKNLEALEERWGRSTNESTPSTSE
jgi:trk system potassium uptake protein TrkA